MASSIEYVEYVCDQISGAGNITFRKMFGEYGLYCNGKFFGCVSDDVFFVKPTEAGAASWEGLSMAPPYPGAKDHYVIEDLDNRDKVAAFVQATVQALPEPKKRKK